MKVLIVCTTDHFVTRGAGSDEDETHQGADDEAANQAADAAPDDEAAHQEADEAPDDEAAHHEANQGAHDQGAHKGYARASVLLAMT